MIKKARSLKNKKYKTHFYVIKRSKVTRAHINTHASTQAHTSTHECTAPTYMHTKKKHMDTEKKNKKREGAGREKKLMVEVFVSNLGLQLVAASTY